MGLDNSDLRAAWPKDEPPVGVEFTPQGDAVLHRAGRRFTIPQEQIDKVRELLARK